MVTFDEEEFVAEKMAEGAAPVATAKERDVRREERRCISRRSVFCVGRLFPVIKERPMPQRIKHTKQHVP